MTREHHADLPDPELHDLAAAIVASPHAYSEAALAWALAELATRPPEQTLRAHTPPGLNERQARAN